MKKVSKGLYRHYKGSYYYVLGVAVDKTKGRPKRRVLYKRVSGMPEMRVEDGKVVHVIHGLEDEFYTRDFNAFLDHVKVKGQLTLRFAMIEDVDELVKISY